MKKSQRVEMPAPATETETGPRWLEAVVDSERLKPVEEPTSRLLIVHGRARVRLELSDKGQIILAARLLRELGWE